MNQSPSGMPKELERRLHRRYILTGSAKFHISTGQVAGGLVNIGLGGMLVRTDVTLPHGQVYRVDLRVPGYAYGVEVFGRVAGTQDGKCAIHFAGNSRGLAELLVWLAQENMPWTTTNPLGAEPLPPARETTAG